MDIFWVLLFFIVIAASFILAYRSMKSMQEMPSLELPYGLFLVRQGGAFNLETLSKLHEWAASLRVIFSLERLSKGTQSALVIYAPLSILDFLPELQLLQLENYLPPSQNTFVWSINPKSNSKKIVVSQNFFNSINLSDDQQFFWQVVCSPQRKGEFQVTIRAMVVDLDQSKRVELAKFINKHITASTGLIKQRDDVNSVLYNDFDSRVLVKKEESAFLLTTQEIIDLLV